MHNPGICGVILAYGSPMQAQPAAANGPGSKAAAVSSLIRALNADSDMVLVALGEDADALAPTVWAQAANVVQLAPAASEADALRTALREVLNRGRDAALVVSLEHVALNEASSLNAGRSPTAEAVHRMVAAYRDAGDEIWAVLAESAMGQGYPVLLGRKIIELFLRGQDWSAARDILAANAAHVHTLGSSDAEASGKAAPAAGKSGI